MKLNINSTKTLGSGNCKICRILVAEYIIFCTGSEVTEPNHQMIIIESHFNNSLDSKYAASLSELTVSNRRAAE
jgi:hypothetical protein